MELIEGVALSEMFNGFLAIPEFVVYIGVQVSRTLGYVHSCGVFRNDVKPQNIMVDVHGKIFVIDFGIAVRDQTIGTVPDFFIGTPAYMAPEAFETRPPNARMDIYGLGIVLYQLAVGEHPFPHAKDLPSYLKGKADQRPRPISEP